MVTLVEQVFTSDLHCPMDLAERAIAAEIQQIWGDRRRILDLVASRPLLSDAEFLLQLGLPVEDSFQQAIAACRAYLAEIFQLAAAQIYPTDRVSEFNRLPARNWDFSELVWVVEEVLGIEVDDSEIVEMQLMPVGQWIKALLLRRP